MDGLKSEQLPNDGSFYLTKLIKDANEELKKLGEHGKTCQLKRSGNSITLQFNFEGQRDRGCGCRLTQKGIERAAQIARLVTTQLIANNFTWDWYDRLLGKRQKEKLPLAQSFKTQFQEYKRNWFRFKAKKKLKHPEKQWYASHLYIEKIADSCNSPIDEDIIKKIIESTPADSHPRKSTLNSLASFCDDFDLPQLSNVIQKYKKKNNPLKRESYRPDDREIEYVFHTKFEVRTAMQKRWEHRIKGWQFLYGLLAVYGLRIHEAWNIANWNTPVVLRNKDWLAVELLEDGANEFETYVQSDRLIIPSILDPDNKDKILCIKHDTKTGYRMVLPLSPQGKNWLSDFNLIGEFTLPDIPNPLKLTSKYGSYTCTTRVCRWFSEHNYGFTPHALRHAYNHRGHGLGYNPTLLAKSLGHGVAINESIYLRNIPHSRDIENFKNAIDTQVKKQSRLEELEIENIALKRENELLKAQLQLIYSERSGTI